MYLTIYPNSINSKHIQQAVQVLEKGGLLIYPTDTVYAIGCLSTQQQALKKLAKLKAVKLEKANFSFLFEDISGLSQYVKPMDTATFSPFKPFVAWALYLYFTCTHSNSKAV